MESHSQGEVLSLGGWELGSGRWLFDPVEFEVWAEYPFELRYRQVEVEYGRLGESLREEVDI